jgi:hypothetical protein
MHGQGIEIFLLNQWGGAVRHERVWDRNYVFCHIVMEIYVIGCTSTFSSTFCLHTNKTKTYLCISDGLHHSPTINLTQSTLKHESMRRWWASTSFNQDLHTIILKTIKIKTHYKGRRCVLRSQTPPYILTQRKQIKKLPKVILHLINHKETKSHVSPWDSTFN